MTAIDITRALRSLVALVAVIGLGAAGHAPGGLAAQEAASGPGVSKRPPTATRPEQQLTLPLRTWVARPLPRDGDDVPCRQACKHMRLEYNPDDGLIYLMGGDHNGSEPGHLQSGRNEVYTYSIAQDRWHRVQPYCRPDRGAQPNGADEVGWTYDRTRRVLWMVPGFMHAHRDKCPGGELVRERLMQYDPEGARWTVVEASLPGRGGWTTQAFHDDVTDTIIAFSFHGGAGAVAWTFDVARSHWTRVPLSSMAKARLADTIPTFDRTGRHIYLIPQRMDRLFRYHVDRRTAEDLGPTPPGGYVNERMPIWDSVNGVLLFPAIEQPSWTVTLHVWDPRSGKWTTDPMKTEPPGQTVNARLAVFDPSANVLMMMGRNNRVWLYRYGSGETGREHATGRTR